MNFQNENTEFTIHPEYGEIELNVWKPVYAHRTCKKSKISEIVIQPNYEIMFNVNKEMPFIIYHKK